MRVSSAEPRFGVAPGARAARAEAAPFAPGSRGAPHAEGLPFAGLAAPGAASAQPRQQFLELCGLQAQTDIARLTHVRMADVLRPWFRHVSHTLQGAMNALRCPSGRSLKQRQLVPTGRLSVQSSARVRLQLKRSSYGKIIHMRVTCAVQSKQEDRHGSGISALGTGIGDHHR